MPPAPNTDRTDDADRGDGPEGDYSEASQAALQDVIGLLDVEPIEVNIFRGLSPDEDRQRVFGGQVAGQALVSAARTVGNGARVHSLHAYFLRPGDPKVPILYTVDRIRDGRSFTTRRVVAIQHGLAIFNLSASFQQPEAGEFEHGLPMPDVAPPEAVADWRAQWKSVAHLIGDRFDRPQAIDLRYVSGAPPSRTDSTGTHQQVWMRAAGSLPDDPVLHTCLLTYASDLTLLDTALLPHGTSSLDDSIMMASLDHAMWFHRSFRADEWLLYDQQSLAASGGRGLARGAVFRRDGAHVASVMQEGLIRRRRRT